MFKAFLDDFNKITIEQKNQGPVQYLLYDFENFTELNIASQTYTQDFAIIELYLQTELDLGQDYYIYNSDGIKTQLLARDIVKTDRFDYEYNYQGPLGNRYSKNSCSFYVWSPLSSNVSLILSKPGQVTVYKTYKMLRNSKGVWQADITGDFAGYGYRYLVQSAGSLKYSADPYSLTSSYENMISNIVDPKALSFTDQYANPKSITDCIIYEVSVRDFTEQIRQNDSNSETFIKPNLVDKSGNPIGFDYLKQLGVTHIQLMPVNYFGSIQESQLFSNYNWGYDVMHHLCLSGRTSVDPNDPLLKVHDLQNIVKACHSANIGVILDVVFNHVYDVKSFCYDILVNDYFFRFDQNGNYSNGTGVGNELATQRIMVRRYILDVIKQLVNIYNVDGFRFDLMGIIDIDTINFIKKMLKTEFTKPIYLYGEGWNLDTTLDYQHRVISQNYLRVPEIGFFNDYFRDAIKGSTFNLENLGIANCNHSYYGDISNILLGTKEPTQSINFISCHDNHTLCDRYKSVLDDYGVDHNIRNSYNLLLLSQGVCFMHSGCEFKRSKQMVENSYNAPDVINQIDWDLISQNLDLLKHVQNLIKCRKMFEQLHFNSLKKIHKYCNVVVVGDVIFYSISNYSMPGGYSKLLVIFNLGYNDFFYKFDQADSFVLINDHFYPSGKKLSTDHVMINQGFVAIIKQF